MVLCIETRKPRLLRAACKTRLLPNRSVSKNTPTIASYKVGNAHSVPRLVFLRNAECASPIELTSFWSRWEGGGHFPNIAAEKWWVRSVRQAVIVDHALDIACWGFQSQQTRCATNCRAACRSRSDDQKWHRAYVFHAVPFAKNLLAPVRSYRA